MVLNVITVVLLIVAKYRCNPFLSADIITTVFPDVKTGFDAVSVYVPKPVLDQVNVVPAKHVSFLDTVGEDVPVCETIA